MPNKIANHLYYQVEDPEPDRKKAEKSDTRAFWFLWIPLGALAGFLACVLGDSGGFFLPVWGVTTFVLWAVFGREK
jgi:hypothetical protein